MGLCIGAFGIPLIGDRDCLDEYRNDRNKRQAVRQAEHSERTEDRQAGRTDRTRLRNEQQAESTFWRNLDGEGWLQEAFQGVGEAASGIGSGIGQAAGGVGGLLFGTGGAGVDVTPLLIGGAVLGIGVLVLTKA